MNAGILKLACLGTLAVAAIIPEVEAGTLTVRRLGGYAGATGGGEYNVTPSDALLYSAYSPKALLEIDGVRGFESFGLESEGYVTSYSQSQSSTRGGETSDSSAAIRRVTLPQTTRSRADQHGCTLN